MKQVVMHSVVEVRDVPAPQPEAGKLVVQVTHSCISGDTEMSGANVRRKFWARAQIIEDRESHERIVVHARKTAAARHDATTVRNAFRSTLSCASAPAISQCEVT